jgi:hypothetical protein
MMRLEASQACDLTGFVALMHKMLRSAWGKDWGTFCEAFPNGMDPENVKIPAITYMLKSKRPGVVGKDGTREIKPRFRQEIIPAKEDNASADVFLIYAQWFDHEIVFEVWEENNSELTQLGERFEDFMMTYAGYFKSKGVGEILFDRMLNGYESKMFRDNLVCRHYTYYMRLEKHVVVPSNVIKEIIGQVEIYDTLPGDSDQNIESINFES